jgi:hypothetical protein
LPYGQSPTVTSSPPPGGNQAQEEVMPTIYLASRVEATATAVWSQISDIRAPERLTNMIHTVDVTGDNERSCATDQGKIVERIISVDDEHRRIAYTAIASPFPISHHNAAMTVIDDEDGCVLTWVTDIEPAPVAEAMTPILAAEFDVIVSRLAM